MSGYDVSHIFSCGISKTTHVRLAIEASTGPPSKNDIAEKCHKYNLKSTAKKYMVTQRIIRQLSNSNKAMILQTSECAIIWALKLLYGFHLEEERKLYYALSS